MSRLLMRSLLCSLLFVSVASAKRRSWDDIKPLDDRKTIDTGVDYKPLENLLQSMDKPVRSEGETLITGQKITFDYDEGFLRMDQNVAVTDDRGVLRADSLVGHFTPGHEITTIDAEGNVQLDSGLQQGKADSASYDVTERVIRFDGNAEVFDEASSNRLSAGQIRLWVGENRRMECAPNARLVINSLRELQDDEVSNLEGVTEVRADRMRYDEASMLIELNDNVWVKNQQVSLDAGGAQIYLLPGNDVDFIEAYNGIRIHSEGRTATARQATYRHGDREIKLEGQARLMAGSNTLSGERIQFWVGENRKIVCEPNAKLMVAAPERLGVSESAMVQGATEVWADRMVLDEEQLVVELEGHVRIRNEQAGMNCEKVRIYLKDINEIDWIEATGEVIIQSDGRKALADRAEYHVDEGRFVLEGNPKLKEDRNIIAGDRIVFWQGSGRMVCEPNVRVLLFPDEDIRKRLLKGLEE